MADDQGKSEKPEPVKYTLRFYEGDRDILQFLKDTPKGDLSDYIKELLRLAIVVRKNGRETAGEAPVGALPANVDAIMEGFRTSMLPEIRQIFDAALASARLSAAPSNGDILVGNSEDSRAAEALAAMSSSFVMSEDSEQ